MKEADMETAGDLIHEVLCNMGNAKTYASVAAKVETLCRRYPLYAELQS